MDTYARIVETPFALAYDGPVDRGIEHAADRVVSSAAAERETRSSVTAEAAAHALLRLVCDRPGTMGRVRAARVVGSLPVPCHDVAEAGALARYGVRPDWTVRELVALVDATIDGGLVAQTIGPRPLLVLTRAGYQALAALEGSSPDGG